MFHSVQDPRLSTLAINQSIKYRKNCLLQASPANQNRQQSSFLDQQNIQPLVYKDSKSLNGSAQFKRENRRKAGSIVKIVRNFKSNEKDDQAIPRKQLSDKNNYLNLKLQCDRNNDQSIGVYKKLYEQNKILNQALKVKIYQKPSEKSHNTNPLIGISNLSYSGQDNQFSRKIYTSNQDITKSYDKNQQHIFNSKYQKMLEEYDKKKNFIKEEMQAMKQKSSLQNFSTYDCSLNNQQVMTYKTLGGFYKDQSLERPKYEALNQKLKTIQAEPSFISGFKGSFSDKKEQNRSESQFDRSHSIALKLKQAVLNEKEEEINRKFKAYQLKLQKHKDFEKRNPSVTKKDTNQSSIDKSSAKNVAVETKTQNFVQKHQGNQSQKVFFDAIEKQIQKDEQIRVIKHHLRHIPIQEIETIIKQKFEIQAHPQNFKLSIQQYDPFYELEKSDVPIEQTIRKLIGAIEIADNFWKNIVKGRLSKTDLEQVFETLNYGKRDQIGISQLARELSFHLGKTIRIRQIYLIYQRLTPLTKNNFVTKLE